MLQGGTTLYEVADADCIEEFAEPAQASEKPNVWIGFNSAIDECLSDGRFGVKFGLKVESLADMDDDEAVKELYNSSNLDLADNSYKSYVPWAIRFSVGMREGDYIAMPSSDQSRVHVGLVTSDVMHNPELSAPNYRKVRWSDHQIPTNWLVGFPYQNFKTIRERLFPANAAFDAAFWRVKQVFEENDLGFDWVPLHLEVGMKLVEDEWWLEANRDEIVDLIQELRQADPYGTTEVNATFDPFNLYQAFCQRDYGSAREQCLETLRGKLGLVSELPSGDSKIWSITSARRVKETLSGDRLDAFWDMFRAAVEMDPADDPECREEFAKLYNRVHAAGDRPEWRRVLSTWLYLIDPTKFVHIYRFEKLGILRELGLDYHAVNDEVDSGMGYVNALVRANTLAKNAGLTLLDLNRESTIREMIYPDASTRPGPPEYSIDHMLDDGVFFDADQLERIKQRFEDKKNLILQGPPGVGKTFVSKRLAYVLMGEQADDRIRNVQFHQSYSYEEFVQGYRPTTNAQKQLIFELQPGAFLRLCREATKEENRDKKYVIVIDEINRGNLSRVFGELLSLIERDKREEEFEVALSSGMRFSVPENVYILGTMNLADRSLAGMDYAMRRRFAFVTLKPQFGESVFEDWLTSKNVPPETIERINSSMSALNDEISEDRSLGRNFAIGHSYFCDIRDGGEENWNRWYRNIVETELQPLLEEYWFDSLTKADDEVEKLLDGVPENS